MNYEQHEAALRAAMLAAVTVEDMRAIARVLVDKAKAGNVEAMALLFRMHDAAGESEDW